MGSSGGGLGGEGHLQSGCKVNKLINQWKGEKRRIKRSSFYQRKIKPDENSNVHEVNTERRNEGYSTVSFFQKTTCF